MTTPDSPLGRLEAVDTSWRLAAAREFFRTVLAPDDDPVRLAVIEQIMVLVTERFTESTGELLLSVNDQRVIKMATQADPAVITELLAACIEFLTFGEYSIDEGFVIFTNCIGAATTGTNTLEDTVTTPDGIERVKIEVQRAKLAALDPLSRIMGHFGLDEPDEDHPLASLLNVLRAFGSVRGHHGR